MTKRILICLFTVIVMIGMLTTTAFANNVDTWDGSADTSWYNDIDTEFTLTTAEQLAGLAKLVDGGNTFEGKTVNLGKNIDLYAEDDAEEKISFDPIGYGYDIVFKGTFDGQGHTISNLYQNGWALGYSYGTQGGGLFASVVDATIKNVNIDNAEIVMECVDMGILVGYSYGNCVYENISITNSLIANYQRYTGGVVGEVNGIQKFKNIYVDENTVISSLWGDFDCSLGGIIGGKYGDAAITLEDCYVACEINAYNDVTSSYQWYAYRRAGMLIGNTETATDNGATAEFLTTKNCTVIYGDWANYTYCEFAGTSWPYVRVQEGYSNSAYSNPRYGHPKDANGNEVVDDNHVHNEGEDHFIECTFDQLYGGGQGVYGEPAHNGVVVIYPDEEVVASVGSDKYTDLHEAMVAAKSGETVRLWTDVDLAGTEWEPVSFRGAFDGQGYTISNLTINKPGVSNTGFITSLNGTFENVTFTNPTVIGGECTGVVAGRAGGSAALAQNITVNGTIKVETTHDGYARAGVIVGGWAYGNYKNITVDGADSETSYIKHTGGGDGRYVAGIVGHADDVDSYVDCTVKNITISSPNGWLCGGIAGPGPADALVSGCSVENMKIGADYSGALFGWYYGSGTIENCSIKNVEFTAGSTNNGAIGGYSIPAGVTVRNVLIENVVNADGSALLSYAAMVDDGTDVIYYTDIYSALKAVVPGATITLLDDLTITEDWDCRNNGAKITVPVTIDGNSHTITLTGNIDDRNWNTVFRFEDNAIVNNLTIDVSNATGVQRGISAKLGITMDNCVLIGNGTTSRMGVIFGEGAGAAIGDVEASITNSEFINWGYGVSDNRNGQDAKAVSIADSSFTNASVLVSAADAVAFTGNEMSNSWANIKSYTKSETLEIYAVGNDLEANSSTKENKVTASLESTINADPGFNIVLEGEDNTQYYEVTFNVAPEGANINVVDLDGDICDTIGGIYALPDGKYSYTVSKAGYYTATGTFTVSGAGRSINVNLFEIDYYWYILLQQLHDQKFEVTAAVAGGGKITPEGISEVKYDNDITYTITPDDGYAIADVVVDGESVGAVSEYTFENVNEAHTITALFEELAWENPFGDIDEDNWFYEDIEYAYENGLMIGTSDDSFSPSEIVNRAMLVTVLWRLEGSPVVDSSVNFADVPAGEWYTDAVNWASANGIVNGYGDGIFGATNDLTHEQVTAILNRYAVYKKLSENVSGNADDAYTNSEWAENNILWAEENGLFNGIGSDISNLTKGATRAELAAYLRRFCEKFIIE